MENNSLIQKLSETKLFINSKSNIKPKLGFVLGSGLGNFAETVSGTVRIPYHTIPHFKAPKVEGHAGELLLGTLHNVPIAILKGRIHYFEGHTIHEVVYPVRTLAHMGIETLFLTNAVGGLLKMKVPGIMVITDQINLTGTSALIGPNENSIGPRFPDMSEAYDKKLTKTLKTVLQTRKISFKTGVYCGLSGPAYETPAEIQMLKKLGVGAVGMSTVNEVLAARHMGVKCVGMSCVTNAAAGIQKTPLNHEEVTENAKKIQNHFSAVLGEFTKAYSSL